MKEAIQLIQIVLVDTNVHDCSSCCRKLENMEEAHQGDLMTTWQVFQVLTREHYDHMTGISGIDTWAFET